MNSFPGLDVYDFENIQLPDPEDIGLWGRPGILASTS